MKLLNIIAAGLFLCAPLWVEAQGTLTISGSVTTNNTEQNIVSGGETIILTLSDGATWLATATDSISLWQTAFSSTGSWNEVSSLFSSVNMQITDDSIFTITLPSSLPYVIYADELITITVPDILLATGSSLNTGSFTIADLAPEVTITGTALPSVLESNIRAGNYTLIFDVKYDTWAAGLGNDNSETDQFLAGITGNRNWDDVTAELTYNDLDRDSDSRIITVLPVTPNYAITSNETVSVNIPASSFTGTSGINYGAAFTVTNQSAATNVTWSTGSSTITEGAVRAGSLTLTLDLTSTDSWKNNIPALTGYLKSGLNSGTGSEWDTKILPFISVVRDTPKKLIVTFEGDASFNIDYNQTISYAISDSALLSFSGVPIAASPTSFNISPAAAGLSISPSSINEENFNGSIFDLVLSEDTFSDYASLTTDDFSLSAPSGTSIGSISNRTTTGVRLILAYTGDIDVNSSLQVTIVDVLSIESALASNIVSIIPLIEPVITSVSIPDQTFKIGDVVPVTIAVQNDGGQSFVLESGTVGGRNITGFARINSTTYTASFTVISGTADIPALSDIPVLVQLKVSGRTGNLYSVPISQSNDLIDANPPIVNSYQALGTLHKIGDYVQLIAIGNEAGCTIDNTLTSINGVLKTSTAFSFLSEAGGSYFLSYQVSSNDIDVTLPASLAGQIVLKDPAGNNSVPRPVEAVSPLFSIDAHVPVISIVTAPDSAYIIGETLILTITGDGPGYSLSPETFINGISASGGRFSFNGQGPVYTLNYPIQSGDAEVNQGNLNVSIVLKDIAGNKSNAVTSFTNNVVVYTVKPTASITGTNSICIGDSVILYVNLTGNPKWNILVSDGTSSINFNQIATSPFSFKIAPQLTANYSIQSVSDNTGLANAGTGQANITVHAKTPVSITSLNSAYSLSSDPVNLSATPSGGLFSGPGVFSYQNKFYPSIAGLPDSPHKILYTYSNEFGCISKDSALVSVIEATGGIIMEDLYCYNSPPFDAQALIPNHPEVMGQFQLYLKGSLIPDGAGIHDNGNNSATITPTMLTPGEYTIMYRYFLIDFLKLEKNFTIEFIEAPKIIGLREPAEICENAESLNLTGNAINGYFSGNGITGSSTSGFMFNPEITGSGIVTITYSDSTVNGCINHKDLDITVNPITPVHINDLSVAYNLLRPTVDLSASSPGGIFSGPGVDPLTNKFYPGIAGVPNSPHKIVYTYTNAKGCVSIDSAFTSVIEASGTLVLENVYCYNASPFTARAIPGNPSITGKFELKKDSNLIPDGSGIHDNSDNTASISPSVLSPGDFTLIYKYFENDSFSIQKNFTVESIKKPKILNFPDPSEICANAASFSLTGDASSGHFSGDGVTGNSLTGYKFDPSVTVHGLHTITYTDSTLNGCKNQSEKDITVFFIPALGFRASDSCVNSVNPGTEIFFSNTTTDKDSVSKWYWNFDDVNSGAKNYSSNESPSHFFNKSGKYSVLLTDTTTQGCVDRYEITLDFGDKPVGIFEVVNKCFTPGGETEFKSITTSNDGISQYYWNIYLPGGEEVDTVTSSASLKYILPDDGKYFVEHAVTSNTNCTLTLSDSFLLKPTVVLKPGVPYNEELNTNEGGWSGSKVIGIEYPGFSWRWGLPDYENLSAIDKKGWYIRRDSSNIAELSYLISSCFNISAVERPIVKLDIYRNFGSNQDATALQSSTDNGITWNTLGNPGDGINWYSDYQTTNYAYESNYGWANPTGSIPDSSWVHSRHILDPVAGSVNLQLRFVFGAKESNVSGYEGFAFRNFTIGERERFSVLEHFTNTTPLNPVKDKAKSSNIKVNNLYNKGLLYKDFIKLEYHTRFPSVNDPINIFNQDVPGSRAFYYGVNSVPYSLLDGGDRTSRRFDFSDTKFEPKEVDINLRSLEDPPVAITIDKGVIENTMNLGIHLKALQNMPANEKGLYVILYETLVSGFTAENGETQFLNVVRRILPDAAGTTISQAFSATPADTTRLTYNFSTDITNLNNSKLRVAVYLQNDFSGEIYQAALSDYSKSIPVGTDRDLVLPNKILIYPNPAKDFIELSINGDVEKDSKLEFFDQLGRTIYITELQEYESTKLISTSDFIKGIYFIRITANGVPRSEVMKLVIMK